MRKFQKVIIQIIVLVIFPLPIAFGEVFRLAGFEAVNIAAFTIQEKSITVPTPTIDPLLGLVDFIPSKDFNYATLKSYNNFEYENEEEEQWLYRFQIHTGTPPTFEEMIKGSTYRGASLQGLIGGKTKIFYPPIIWVIGSNKSDNNGFVKAIDFFVGDRVFTFSNLRHSDTGIDPWTFFYLGETGKLMVEAIAKSKSISIRLVLRDNTTEMYEIESPNLTPYVSWCKILVKHKIFDLFSTSELIKADNLHKATLH